MCTACKEAKYELIFEGIWSRHTHPKDFPVDEWRTQFSKIIGASHSNPNPARNGRGQQRNRYRSIFSTIPKTYSLTLIVTVWSERITYNFNLITFFRLWSYGNPASEELAYLAKYGMTRRLEAQMKLFSTDIR